MGGNSRVGKLLACINELRKHVENGVTQRGWQCEDYYFISEQA